MSQTIICKNIAEELTSYLAQVKYDKLFVLADENTAKHCYPLIQSVAAVEKAPLITIKPGDTHKNIEQLATVWHALSSQGASRQSLLINIGGGLVTDLGGFAGATFKRGIRTINIPTTLMASVDAAIGGKTGVNFDGLKNEIGSFYPPLCVLIDCRFLQTLDKDNLLSGYAEMMKHALISDMNHYTSVMLYDLDLPVNEAYLNQMVEQSIAVKERIVKEDPKEQGIRKALNFGHTIGHAVESLSFDQQTPLLHGHAVAIGLVCELYLSYKLCGFEMSHLSQVVYYIKEYYKPYFFGCKDYDQLYAYMQHDKKNEGGHINFTLLSQIGDVRIDQQVDKEIILEALDFYRESFGI